MAVSFLQRLMMEIPLTQAKRMIALVWYGSAMILILIVAIQANLGIYKEDYDKAWGWLSSTILPTLSLITGVLVADAGATTEDSRKTSAFMFYMALGASLFYILLVVLTIIMGSQVGRIELMNRSHGWSGLLQGVVGGYTGFFFAQKSQATAPGAGDAARVVESAPSAPTATPPAKAG